MKIVQVEPAFFPMLADWQREYTTEDILTHLKKEMMSPQNWKLSQPLEGGLGLLDLLFILVILWLETSNPKNQFLIWHTALELVLGGRVQILSVHLGGAMLMDKCMHGLDDPTLIGESILAVAIFYSTLVLCPIRQLVCLISEIHLL